MLSNAVGEVADENVGKKEKQIPQGKSVMKKVFINMFKIRIGLTWCMKCREKMYLRS